MSYEKKSKRERERYAIEYERRAGKMTEEARGERMKGGWVNAFFRLNRNFSSTDDHRVALVDSSEMILGALIKCPFPFQRGSECIATNGCPELRRPPRNFFSLRSSFRFSFVVILTNFEMT